MHAFRKKKSTCMENYLGASVVAQVKDDSNMTHGRSWEFRGIRNSMKDLFT